MNFLRKLSIRDVGVALKRGELGLAVRIGNNLCHNALGNARANLSKRVSVHAKQAVRRSA
jgi:hypothetical protein